MNAVRHVGLILTLALIPACGGSPSNVDVRLPETLPSMDYPNGHPLVRDVGVYGSIESTHVDTLNSWRVSQGLPVFASSVALASVARAYSEHETIEKFFAHLDPEGDYLADRLLLASGIQMVYAAETLMYGPDPSASTVLAMFLASPPHAAILRTTIANTVGIGIWFDGVNYFVTYEFIWR